MANEIPIDLVMRVNDQMSTVLDSVAAAADDTSKSFDKLADEGSQISNNLTRNIPLLERISTKFFGVGDSAKKASGIKWDESTNRWRDANSKFISSQEAMQKGFTNADKALYQYKKEAGSAEDATTKLSKSMRNGSQASEGFSAKIVALGNIAGDLASKAISAVANAIGDVVNKMITGNAEMERYETQFGVLLGSTDKAKQRLKELADFGARTPFELPEVVRADKVLQGFGLHSEEAAKKFGMSGEQIRTLAGDLAAGTGASFEEMATYLGKFSSGSTGEVISRFQELGVTTREELAKMGLQFSKSGELTTPTAEAFAVLAKVAQQKFGGMMDAQSKTFEGMLSNLEDWKTQTINTIGAPIFEVLKDKLGVLLEYLGSDAVKGAINSFASGIAATLGAVIDWFTQNWPTIQTVITAVFNAIAFAWNNILKPVIDFVITLFSDLRTNTVDDFGAMSETIYSVMNGIGDVVNDVLVFITDMWKEYGGEITAFVRDTWNTVSDIINGVIGVILKIVDLAMPAIQNEIQKYMFAIRVIFEVVWSAVTLVVKTSLDLIKGIVNSVLALLNGDIDGALKIMRDMFTGIWTNIKTVVTQTVEDVKNIVDEKLAESGDSTDKQLARMNKFFETAWANIYTAVETAINNVRSWITSVLTKINEDVEWWLNTIKNRWNTFTQNVHDDVVLKFNEVKNHIVGILKAIIDLFTIKIPEAIREASAFIGGIEKAISDRVSSIIAYGAAIISGLVQKITDGVESARYAMSGVMNAINDSISNRLSAIYDFGANIVTSIANGIRSAPGVIMQALNDIVIGAVNRMLSNFGIAPISSITGVTASRTSVTGAGAASSGRNTVFNLTANYGNQDERSLRDDVQMLQMLYGGV